MTVRTGRIYANALAKHVHAPSTTTQAVRESERLYDRKFPGGACLIETAHHGGLRIISLDESMCINVAAADEGRLFTYTDGDSVECALLRIAADYAPGSPGHRVALGQLAAYRQKGSTTC